jgi:predicted O-methyltransferase YrrM
MEKNSVPAQQDENVPEFLVHPDIERYAEQHTSPEPEILQQLSHETHLKTVAPQMLSGHVQGILLRMISCMIKPRNVLEIGTFTGYSAICLSEGIPEGGVLHTVECNPELEEIAMKYFKLAGISEKVKLHIGDAFEIVPALPGPFDLVFIDANKDDYIRYFEIVFDKVISGGFIIADNTLWYGKVVDKNADSDNESSGIAGFNNFVQNHKRVENLLLTIRDGLTIIRKL